MSEAVQPPTIDPVRVAVDCLRRALDEVLFLEPAALCPDELRELTGAVLVARNRCDAAVLRTVPEVDRRGVAATSGAAGGVRRR